MRRDSATRTRSFGPKMEAKAPRATMPVVTRAPAFSMCASARSRKSAPHRPDRAMLTAWKFGLSAASANAARE